MSLPPLATDPTTLDLVDSVGAHPVHLAFLHGHTPMGKELVTRYPHCTTYEYKAGPYAGENVLHIAIIRRDLDLVRWLVRREPRLLNAETTGAFFNPRGAYFGGYPLLFAVSCNSRDMVDCILATKDAAGMSLPLRPTPRLPIFCPSDSC